MTDRSSGAGGKTSAERQISHPRERYEALGKAMREFRRQGEMTRDRLAKNASMHPTDFNCIGFLHHSGPTAPREIIAYLGLTSGSGTALFDRLESQGYIRRLPNPADRRSVLIDLDAKRAAPVVQRYLEFEDVVVQAFDNYNDTEIALITGFFGKLQEITAEIEKRAGQG